MGHAYARFGADNSWNEGYDRPAIHSLAGDVVGLDVLDVGCAAGVLSEQLLARGARVVGVDGSRVMVELARARCGGRAEFHLADLVSPLDFLADGSFDLVTASLVMHYLEDWGPTLGELRRVLRPGGALVMSVHHSEGWHWFDLPNYFVTELVNDTWDIGGRSMDVQFYHRPLGAMFGALREAGFRVDDIVEPMPLPVVEAEDPRAWAMLTTMPRFLYFRAVKG